MMMDLVRGVLDGNRRALARLITSIENDQHDGQQALDELFTHTGNAQLIGVTGPSGAGKSTLVNGLVKEIVDLNPDSKVAVIAVDPSSPFSGGAVLGDRIRMRAVSTHPNVFIRSMASRGALGGLAHHTQAVALILDAAGFDHIVIETVGAGQSEVEIAKLAHTVIVVEAPGLGDDIQAAKAGILEIADVMVLNKADRPGADATEMALQAMLAMGYPLEGIAPNIWVPPVVRTIATNNEGIPELMEAVKAHETFIRQNGRWQERDQQRLQAFLQSLLIRERNQQWHQMLEERSFREIVQQVYDRQLSPYAAVELFTK